MGEPPPTNYLMIGESTGHPNPPALIAFGLFLAAVKLAVLVFSLGAFINCLFRSDLRRKKIWWFIIFILPLFVLFYAQAWLFSPITDHTVVFFSLASLWYFFAENRKRWGYILLAFDTALLILTWLTPWIISLLAPGWGL